MSNVHIDEKRACIGELHKQPKITYEIRPEKCRRTSWVDVNDELPDESGRYWCYVQYHNSTGISNEQDNCSFNAHSKSWICESWKGGERVIYWRDLELNPSLSKGFLTRSEESE